VNITGLGLQHEPWIQWSDAVVEPRAERREEWWIFARLAQALGLKSPLDAGPAPDLWVRIDHMLHARGHSLDDLRAGGQPLAFEPLTPGKFFAEQLQTGDGKVDCCPPAFADALERAERIFLELEREGLERLKLITRRDPYMHNSWYANVPAMKRGDRDRNASTSTPRRARARPRRPREGAHLERARRARARDLVYAGLMRGVVALTTAGEIAAAAA